MTQGHPQPPGPFGQLSDAARLVWGKHDRDTDGWLPLWRHMADSAAVAGRLWDEWVPGNVKRLVADVLPEGQEDARRLAVWLAASHDAGKATPAFSCQVDALAERMRGAGLDMPYQKQFGDDRRLAPHGLAGQLLIQEWLSERYGWSDRAAGQFAIVAGGHHGVPPGHAQIHHLDLHEELLRTPGASEPRWREVQYELLDSCAETAHVQDRLTDWRGVKLPQPVQAVLTAVVILADWVASSSELFPYYSSRGSGGDEDRLEAAWRGLDLPGPWTPDEPQGDAAELFASRFDLPEGASVRPVQEEAVRIARTMPEPGLLVIEAPMGEGKTEAALAVAEIFAARTGAGGCFVALPTRATGDAMFSRLLNWLKHLPGEGQRSVFLAHAKAVLNDEFAGLLRTGARTIAAIEADGSRELPAPGANSRSSPAGLVAHQWLRGRKKGMLASFSVGTIDQVLFAGLKSRHLALRHLALAGKVVVIDEVHAYDAYMNAYLERVLHWLGAYRVPVVMLSATLPAARRRALVEAYAGDAAGVDASPDSYPLLTAAAPGAPEAVTARPPAAADRRTDIRLEPLDDDLRLLVDRIAEELTDGGCALVVRNTVDRVLEAAERLREKFGEDRVTVAHSRFLAADRARKDTDLLARFGRDGQRPAGAHVVVASQVVEQSLDIDFDLLVTDLAPVDLMLQRMGRLHRHPRVRPPRLRTARCLVTGVDWQAEPPEPVAGSRGVYQGRHTLLRALAVLRPHLEGQPVCLPSDISPLVQKAYGDEPVGPDDWTEPMAEARRDYRRHLADKRSRAEVFRLGEVRRPGRPLIGWIDAGVGDADDTREGRAQVRDSEESLEVLVVQRRDDGALITVPWLDGGRGGLELPTDAVPSPRAARAVAASALRLPYHFSKPWTVDRTIAELERFVVPAWQVKECPWLAGELIMVLDEHCQTRLSGFELQYNRADGLVVTPAGARDVRVVDRVASFDLVSRPWLPVQRLDGTTAELSLRDVFTQAGEVRRLVGDVPTQEFALLRLLLAVAHDALEGPEDVDAWEELWSAAQPFSEVPSYLDRHRDRFDLLHPDTPFFQVSGLHTEKDEVASLNRIVADVPNGDPFFSMRRPGTGRLTFAEAARWLVHAHAFDPSGIKSGAVGDPRVKAGKGYPQGVAWTGNLGGVFAEGKSLRETLLLNLIAADNDSPRVHRDDRPAWRRAPGGPASMEADPDADPEELRPSGPRDLYTWQSRRLRLHIDEDPVAGAAVTGVVLAYGDPLAPHNMQGSEPMTGWRRSAAQEKKRREPLVYMPQEHDPRRAAWRGLASLLFAGRTNDAKDQRQDAPARLRPAVLDWVSRLANEGALPRRSLIRARTVGAVYGTQQSVIDEMVDDGVTLAVVLLHERDHRYGQSAVGAVDDADAAVGALGALADNLARARGAEPGPPSDTARDLGFSTLDGPYRQWLRALGESDDPYRARREWQLTAHRLIRELGSDLLNAAGTAAWEGRMVDTRTGPRWLNDTLADVWFKGQLRKALPAAVTPLTDEPSEAPA
ncbi:type I-E CRISPR-associated protein Cse1/CasA [Streptomyces sp. NPDC058405]|uniref:type I-E CRISPR-associated protein Cse1/CasA n=1 Tax=Streptomyces sp. NPDC058405 TaxID=3346482 RepID=UPI0036534684